MTNLFRIYCGRTVPASVAQNSARETFVRDGAISRFVAEVVSKAFPAGFTQSSVEGFWRDSVTGRTITEPSVIFEVLAGPEEAHRVREVALAYKSWFSQQAVLVVAVPVTADFV